MRVSWSVELPAEVLTECTGTRLGDYHADPQVMMNVQIKGKEYFEEQYGVPNTNTINVDLGYFCASLLGLEVVFPVDNVPMPSKTSAGTHTFNSVEEMLKTREPGSIEEAGLMPMYLRYYQYMRENKPENIRLRNRLSCWTHGPWTTAVLLRGLDLYAEACVEPSAVHYLLEVVTETMMRMVELGLALDGRPPGAVETMGFADDYAGLLSPAMFSEFASGYIKRIADRFRVQKRMLHIETLKPGHLPCLQEIEICHFDAGTGDGLTIGDMKRHLSIPFCLQMKTVPEMLLSNPKAIQERYRQMVEEGATEMEVELCRGVPPENIHAFVEVARRYE